MLSMRIPIMLRRSTTGHFGYVCPLLLLGLGILLSFRALAQSTGSKALTVCEVFQDLQANSGRMIEVRGELLTGRRTFALRQKDCPTKLRTGDLEWPTAIDLAAAGSIQLDSPAAFSLDEKAVAAMDKLLCFLHESTASELGVGITATFVGELRTREVYRAKSAPDGTPYGGGFGHLGVYPAQLVYRTVKDIVIRQKPR